MMTALIILAAIGFCISLYAYHVELKIKKSISYKPACDLSDRISCSKVMLSPYANLLMASNALVGAAYYALLIVLALFNAPLKLLFAIAVAACIISIGLAYILYAKIKSFCVVCTSIYVINFLILGLITVKMYA